MINSNDTVRETSKLRMNLNTFSIFFGSIFL